MIPITVPISRKSMGICFESPTWNDFVCCNKQIRQNSNNDITLFVTMPTLATNFQLNIFIFEARASLQILFQSLKQKDRISAQVGNVPK